MTPIQLEIRNLLAAATLIPLASALLLIFLGKRLLGRASAILATLLMAGSCACAIYALVLWRSHSPGVIVDLIPWIPIPGQPAQWLPLGLLVDDLTIAMMAMVTLIATLVHLYSVGYMKGDKRYELFFAYLSLFTFSMLGIVISNSIMQLFVFWELVGLTSYLLIGFWYEKRGPQLACKKAFVMNRIGDAGFLIGFGILFYKLGGNTLLPAAAAAKAATDQGYVTIFESLQQLLQTQNASFTDPPGWLTLAGIGLFCGAIGKSAQFPLHTWLPDAMEGPTPVSSIVHSATMVAAGVYLTARVYPILTPGAHLFIATIGLVTLLMAACMALVMTDIKRVLAYSTLSQLGYMILGLGAGAYGYALLHLITHAFFKCCLFQCAGSVIHAAHHQQDMRHYGGLGRKMPLTAACYAVCTLAIAGASIPGLGGVSGFYSKDGLIAGCYNYGHALETFLPLGSADAFSLAHLFYWIPVAVAYLTAFYMARSFAMTFLGKPRDPHLHEHAHEAPITMLVPQLVLATLAVISTPWALSLWGELVNGSTPGVPWVQGGTEVAMGEHAFHFVHAAVGFAWVIGIGLGVALYAPGLAFASRIAALPGVRLIHVWFLNKFYFDGLYDGLVVGLGKLVAATAALFDRFIVDGVVNLAAAMTREAAMSTGRFDNRYVDGAVNAAALAAQSGGQTLRLAHSGRVRLYVMLAFASAALILMAVLIVVFAARSVAPAVLAG